MRKKERRHRVKTLFLILFLLILSFFIFSLLFLSYYLYKSRFLPSFVSPLPKGEAANLKSTSSDTDKLKDLLKKNNIAFSLAVSLDDSFFVNLSSGEEVILSSKKSLEQQISSLQVILSRFTIEGKKFSRLDFRYDKPLVTFR